MNLTYFYFYAIFCALTLKKENQLLIKLARTFLLFYGVLSFLSFRGLGVFPETTNLKREQILSPQSLLKQFLIDSWIREAGLQGSDTGKFVASKLGINSALIKPGMRLVIGSPPNEVMKNGRLLKGEEAMNWWFTTRAVTYLGKTKLGVRKMLSKRLDSLPLEAREYFVPKAPYKSGLDDTVHEILHDVFLSRLTPKQREEFFHLFRDIYQRSPSVVCNYLMFRLGDWYRKELLEKKVSLEQNSWYLSNKSTFLLNTSEVFAQTAAHYLGFSLAAGNILSIELVSHFEAFFESINLKASNSANSLFNRRKTFEISV